MVGDPTWDFDWTRGSGEPEPLGDGGRTGTQWRDSAPRQPTTRDTGVEAGKGTSRPSSVDTSEVTPLTPYQAGSGVPYTRDHGGDGTEDENDPTPDSVRIRRRLLLSSHTSTDVFPPVPPLLCHSPGPFHQGPTPWVRRPWHVSTRPRSCLRALKTDFPQRALTDRTIGKVNPLPTSRPSGPTTRTHTRSRTVQNLFDVSRSSNSTDLSETPRTRCLPWVRCSGRSGGQPKVEKRGRKVYIRGHFRLSPLTKGLSL